MTKNYINDHPLLIFGADSCSELTREICSYNDIHQGRRTSKPFPNGETMLKIDEDVRGCDVFVVISVCRQHDPDQYGYTGINDCLMELLVFGDTLRRASAHRITAVIPHFGYARQDRKAAGRTPITAKLFADLIVQAGYNRVLTMDLHADQIQGFFPREVPLDHLNAGQLVVDYYNELAPKNAVVLAPDSGSMKRADKYRAGFKFPTDLAYIDKDRDPETGEVVSRRIDGNVDGCTVLMLDDIISTAGTMNRAIRLASEKGAESFYPTATHGEFVGNAIKNLQHPAIKEICVTDTIPVLPHIADQLNLRILPTSALLGEAIRRIHRCESISELLGPYG